MVLVTGEGDEDGFISFKKILGLYLVKICFTEPGFPSDGDAR